MEEKQSALTQEVLVGMNFALKYFGWTGRLAQTTTRAVIVYGWTRI